MTQPTPQAAGPAIIHGIPASEERGIGALTLGGYLREVCDRYGANEAAVMRDGADIERWSYAELLARSTDVARALLAAGVGKGTRVGILMTNRLEFLSCVFGTALTGGIATTISTFSTPNELQFIVAEAGCSVLLLERHVLNKDFATMLTELEPDLAPARPGQLQSCIFPHLRHIAMIDSETGMGGIEGWSDFLARGNSIRPALLEAAADSVYPSDPAVLFFSSGSTGKPKGVLSAHRGVCLQLWRWRQWLALGEGVRSWSANGFFWSGNFAIGIGGTLSAGGTLVLQRTFDAEEALALMDAERVSYLFAWPHQWAQLTDAKNWLDVDLSSMRYIDAKSPIAAHPTINTDYIEPEHAYGNTETFTLSAVFPANTPKEISGKSHGIPAAGNTIKIVDPFTGETVQVGERGEIAVKGPTLMLGYLGVPLDETLDDAGFFRTGDGGYIDEQGRLYWEGRLTDIIKTGGANVSPVEVDTVLAKCPGVKVTKTVGIPEELLGELVVACIVPQDGAVLTEEAVRHFAKQQLASYKVPRKVLFFTEAELDMTGSAKVRTAGLREQAAQRIASAGVNGN